LRKKKDKFRLKQTSNSWLLLSLFLITYLIFRLILIDTVVTMNSDEFEYFWLSFEMTGASVLSQFYIIFILFGLCALVEMVSIIKQGLCDRTFGIIVCSFIFCCVIAVQFIFNAQISFLQNEYRLNSSKILTYRLTSITYVPFYSAWDKFKKQKKFRDWKSFDCFKKEDWGVLKKEFVASGGSFEQFELENLEMPPRKRPQLNHFITICDEISFK